MTKAHIKRKLNKIAKRKNSKAAALRQEILRIIRKSRTTTSKKLAAIPTLAGDRNPKRAIMDISAQLVRLEKLNLVHRTGATEQKALIFKFGPKPKRKQSKKQKQARQTKAKKPIQLNKSAIQRNEKVGQLMSILIVYDHMIQQMTKAHALLGQALKIAKKQPT